MADAHLAFSGITGRRLHLGVTGSVSAYRMPDVMRRWMRAGLSVGVTLTKAATEFIAPLTFSALGAQPVLTSMFADSGAAQDSQEVFGHLLPGQTAHALIVAPASAATLARLAHGQADELLACQALAFSGPLVLAPAMNPRMWANAATQANVATLRQRGATVVLPELGSTACLEEGQGRLADVRQIFLHGLRSVLPKPLGGTQALITIGPTAEPWDGVRVWTNRSSGIMGASLALALWLYGAEVAAVCGPGVPWLPSDIRRVNVRTADEMFDAAAEKFPFSDIAAFTAAVADFRPERLGPEKVKKSAHSTGFQVAFSPTRDILATLSAGKKPGQRIIAFAAESGDLKNAMARKLADKRADIMVGNQIGREDSAFAAPTNEVSLLDATGRQEDLPLLSKPQVAVRIVEWLTRL